MLPMLTDIFTNICAQIVFTCLPDVNLGYKFRLMFITDTHGSFSLLPFGEFGNSDSDTQPEV